MKVLHLHATNQDLHVIYDVIIHRLFIFADYDVIIMMLILMLLFSDSEKVLKQTVYSAHYTEYCQMTTYYCVECYSIPLGV